MPTELGFLGAATWGNIFGNFYAQSLNQSYLNTSVTVRILFPFSIINLLFSLIDSLAVCYIGIFSAVLLAKELPSEIEAAAQCGL